jgi:hypothetical protein
VYSAQNRFTISFEDIYREYENTLRTAEVKGLINAKTHAEVRQKLNRRLAQRLAIMKVEASEFKLAACMWHILPSGYFGVREKIARLYSSLRGALR